MIITAIAAPKPAKFTETLLKITLHDITFVQHIDNN